MTFVKPSTITSQTGAYAYKKGVSSNSFNYIDNKFPNILDKSGDNITGPIHVVPGGSITFDVSAGALTFNGGDIVFNNATGINFNNTSGLTFSGTGNLIIGSGASLLNSGTLNITSGGTLGINSGATMHVKSGANSYVDSGGTETISNGGILALAAGSNTNAATGANLNMNSGSYLNLTTAEVISTGGTIWALTGDTFIFQNGGSGFLTIGTGNTFNIHGTFKSDSFATWNTPQSRNSNMPVDYGAIGQGAANWLNIGVGMENTNSASPQIIGQQTLEIPLTRLHHGSTLASVFIAFYVGTTHSGVPAQLPTFTVYRYQPLSNPTSIQYLNTVAVQSPTNPGSGAAWYNSGNVQYYQYICNQNNVIDNTNWLYTMSVADESGTNSLGGNAYLAVTAINQIIPNQSWNI